MATSVDKISSIISDQIPEFIREDHPNFVAFIKAYYEWLEDSELGAVSYESKKLLDYRDIDNTTDQFLTYFKKEFLPNFPEEVLSDKAKLVKNIRSFYRKKGTPEALKFLFRVVYGEDIEIFYPKENILKASDGKWQVPRVFRLTANSPVDLADLIGRRAVGLTSQASCVVAGAYKTLDSGTNLEIYEIYVTDVNRLFSNGETLKIVGYDENGDEIILLSETIIGSLSNIKLDPNNRGLKYSSGDPVVIEGGLSTTSNIVTKAVATVGNVSAGRIESLTLTNGGYGYRLYSNSITSFINNESDNTGSGAVARVVGVDIANSKTIDVNIDAIETNKNKLISDSTYNFQYGSVIGGNKNTTLSDALGFETLTVYPVDEVTLDNRGSKYKYPPEFLVSSYYSTDYSGFKAALPDVTNATWVSNRQNLLDIGKFAAVEVIDGGLNYNNSTDTLYIDGIGNGYGATFSFTTGTGGTITSVTVVDEGEGYRDSDIRINTVNGTGAILRAYRYGEGAGASINVDRIGRIVDIKLENHGAGYISKPNVSLKVADIIVDDVGLSTNFADYVYQQESLDITYSAKVDSVVSNTATTSTIRLYDYNGTINASANLVFTKNGTQITNSTFQNTGSSYIVYGNGLAKANAEFYNGLIEYNGFFLNTDGFLSSDKKLQGSKKYHNFSYVVIAEKALSEYRQLLLDIAHPAGMQLLGYNQILDNNYLLDNPPNYSEIYLSNNHFSGNVTANAFSPSNLLYGTGTAFNSSANANDLIVINHTTQPAVTITNRGYGYRTNSNTIVTLTADGSSAYVVDLLGSSVTLSVNTDSIENLKSDTLNGTYHFQSGNKTLSSTIASSLSHQTITVAPVGHVRILDLGNDTSIPSIYANSYYSTDLSGYKDSRPNPASSVWVANRQDIRDLGIIAHVDVINGGQDYTGADEVYIGGGPLNGYGATFSFTTGTNGEITSVTVATPGTGYVDTTLQVRSTTGSNAEFRVYRYGEGFEAKVNDIGPRKQTKEIVSIASDTQLTMESNTKIFGDGRFAIESGSNTVIISGNTSKLNLIQDDNVEFMLGSTKTIAKILDISGNNITIDTSASSITANASNVAYSVYPYIYSDGVDYKIVSSG